MTVPKAVHAIPLLVLGLCVLLHFSLGGVSEPLRVKLWSMSPQYFPVLGLIGMTGTIGYIARGGRWTNPLVLLTAFVALICATLPYAGPILGRRYPASLDSTGPAIAVRLPLNETIQVAWGGDGTRENYHAAYPDQRWAYDLVVAPHSHDSKTLEDFGCYGRTIVAPIGGEVRSAHDGFLDQVPDNNATTPDNIFGNYVVIKPDGNENRLVIAHMKKGSVLAREGDHVVEGQPIGQCGNSGASTEPHVHIHYLRVHQLNDEVLMTGLPLYFRDHDGPPMPKGGFRRIAGRDVASGDIVTHIGGR